METSAHPGGRSNTSCFCDIIHRALGGSAHLLPSNSTVLHQICHTAPWSASTLHLHGPHKHQLGQFLATPQTKARRYLSQLRPNTTPAGFSCSASPHLVSLCFNPQHLHTRPSRLFPILKVTTNLCYISRQRSSSLSDPPPPPPP